MVRLVSLVVAASIATYARADFVDDIPNELKKPLTSVGIQDDIGLPALKLHSKALQGFADESGGTRVFGSKGHNASVDYVATLAELAGYEVTRQTFPYGFKEAPTERFIVGSPIGITAVPHTPSTPLGGVTAPLVLVPGTEVAPSAGCTPGDFSGIDVKGKIALIQLGTCALAVKVTNAKIAGAIGVVGHNAHDARDAQKKLSAPNDAAYVPVGFISRTAGSALAARLATGESMNAILDINYVPPRQRYSSNVIASSKAGDSSNVIFIGAHLDSVSAGPGINDNGSGSAVVLELAIQLAKYKLTNAVRFAWWTAEEYGLIGSRYYIRNLPEAERKKIALYINLDMVASPNYVYAVYDGDGSAEINPRPTPPGSGAIEKIFTDYFASKKIPTVPTPFSGRSDYGPFIADGVDIPAGGLFTGAEGIKTEQQAALFGGKAGAAYDPNYHAKGDTYDNLNFEAFLVNAKAAAHAIATFVESTKVVDAEKAAGRTKRQVVPAPNDDSPVQGKHLCG